MSQVLGLSARGAVRLGNTWFWVLSCHSISSFLLEEHNLAQLVSKSIPPPSPELEELFCVKQEGGSLQICQELQSSRALWTPLVPGSRIWFPHYQHLTPAACGSSHLHGNCVVHSMCIQKQRARRAAGEQSQEVSWEGMWQEEAVSPAFHQVLPAIGSPLPSALNPNKSHIEKIQWGFRSSDLNCTNMAFAWAVYVVFPFPLSCTWKPCAYS